MGIYVERAFVHLREALCTNADVAKRLVKLEMKTESLELNHDLQPQYLPAIAPTAGRAA